jgi:hypothetical protein
VSASGHDWLVGHDVEADGAEESPVVAIISLLLLLLIIIIILLRLEIVVVDPRRSRRLAIVLVLDLVLVLVLVDHVPPPHPISTRVGDILIAVIAATHGDVAIVVVVVVVVVVAHTVHEKGRCGLGRCKTHTQERRKGIASFW